MSEFDGSILTLVDVDDLILEELVRAAIGDAAANEVTAPITTGDDWSPERIRWLQDLHRNGRSGLSGSGNEATWAVVVDEDVVGAVRLRRTADPEILETGIWLTRRARGHRVGERAVAEVVRKAAALGAQGVQATTSVSNGAALGVLRRLGFALTPGRDGRCVEAFLVLDQA